MNWYKKIKIADQYGVIGAYGYWIDPKGQTLNVTEDLMHRAAIAKSGWLSYQQPSMDTYDAAAQQNIIRVAIWNDEINFDGGGKIQSLTPKQKEVMHDMFFEYQTGMRGKGAVYVDNIGGQSLEFKTVQQFDEFLASIPTQAQASSNDMIKLAKMEEVEVDAGTEMRTVKYLVNPTRQEIIGFINQIAFRNRDNIYRKDKSEIRGVFIKNALYVWDSWDSNHCSFCKAIGGGEECLDKHFECYDEDFNRKQNELFAHDGLTFRVVGDDKLVTNIPSRHKNVGYFHNRGELQPYNSQEESKWGSPWTHTWQDDLE